MRRRLLTTVAVVTGALATLAFTGIISFGGDARAASANVIDDFGCLIDATSIGGGFIVADESHEVQTSSGNVQFKCQGTLPPELIPNKSVRVDGVGCLTNAGLTADSVNHYNPAGQAILTCTVKGN